MRAEQITQNQKQKKYAVHHASQDGTALTGIYVKAQKNNQEYVRTRISAILKIQVMMNQEFAVLKTGKAHGVNA